MLKTMNDLSIRAKILGAFALVLAVTIGLGVFAIARMGTVNAAAIDVRDNWLPSVVAVGRLAAAVQDYRLVVARHVISTSATEMAAIDHEVDDVGATVQKLRADYEPLVTPGEERGLIEAFDRQWPGFVDLSNQVRDASRKNETARTEALYNGQAHEAFALVIKSLNDDIALNIREGKRAADLGAATYASARIWIVAALALSAALCMAAGWGVVHGVSRPIAAMTKAMQRLSGRDMAVEISGLGRKDEIGAMAAAVQVFKENMLTADRLAADQAAENEAKSRRTQQVQVLTRAFETKATELVNAVATAAKEMEATAGAMSATAGQTNQQSAAVASAAEVTAVNVQTVATATEELAASVQEISRQVTQSSQIAAKAAEEAAETNSTVQSLAGCGNSPPSCGKRHFIGMMETDFAGEGAIRFEVGIAVARDLGHFVMPLKVEVGTGRAVPAVQSDLYSPAFDVAAIAVELDMPRTKHVDGAGVPTFDHLNDPPTAEQGGGAPLRHATLASSLGRRTRLHAAAVRVTTQPTRDRPRWRVLRNPAAALIQPNGSSMRLRRRWLTP